MSSRYISKLERIALEYNDSVEIPDDIDLATTTNGKYIYTYITKYPSCIHKILSVVKPESLSMFLIERLIDEGYLDLYERSHEYTKRFMGDDYLTFVEYIDKLIAHSEQDETFNKLQGLRYILYHWQAITRNRNESSSSIYPNKDEL
jgi:hypothetical protein